MTHARVRLPSVLAALVALALLIVPSLAVAQGTWAVEPWTDPVDGVERPAITTQIEFGPDGVGAFVCVEDGATFLFQAEAIAAAPDAPITMSFRRDMNDEVTDFASWQRGADGATVRFAGSDEEFATLVESLRTATSPAFFWVHGEMPTSEAEMEAAQAEGRVLVAVLESQGLDEAIASLPCALP